MNETTESNSAVEYAPPESWTPKAIRRNRDPDKDRRYTLPETDEYLRKWFQVDWTLDVAAEDGHALAEEYYTETEDGLKQPWIRRADEVVYCNPPYSDVEPWVDVAWSEWWRGLTLFGKGPDSTYSITMLLPANRAEQPFWQEFVEPFRDRQGFPLRVHFLPGRRRFGTPQNPNPTKGSAFFGLVALHWSLR